MDRSIESAVASEQAEALKESISPAKEAKGAKNEYIRHHPPKTRGRPKNSRKTDRSDSTALKRSQRAFPASSFEEPLEFATAIFSFGSGQPVRRLTLFDHLQKSPESGPSRQLITNASKYGLIKGNYKADQLELTPDGWKAVDESLSRREISRARVKLAVEEIQPFSGLYEKLVGNKLPAKPALIDSIEGLGVPKNLAEEAIDTFIVNLRFVGLLKTLSGAERIIPLDHLLDSLPISGSPPSVAQPKCPSENILNHANRL